MIFAVSAENNVTGDSSIQVSQIKAVVKQFPVGDFVLATDATDLKKGLLTSMAGKWSGDVDLNDGSLQAKWDEYQER